MSSEEYSFMLWVQNSDGTWGLVRYGRLRGPLEEEAHRIARDVPWRLVSLYGGVLEESTAGL
jgi:hypothetical protein